MPQASCLALALQVSLHKSVRELGRHELEPAAAEKRGESRLPEKAHSPGNGNVGPAQARQDASAPRMSSDPTRSSQNAQPAPDKLRRPRRNVAPGRARHPMDVLRSALAQVAGLPLVSFQHPVVVGSFESGVGTCCAPEQAAGTAAAIVARNPYVGLTFRRSRSRGQTEPTGS
jgi:hypothetical protein